MTTIGNSIIKSYPQTLGSAPRSKVRNLYLENELYLDNKEYYAGTDTGDKTQVKAFNRVDGPYFLPGLTLRTIDSNGSNVADRRVVQTFRQVLFQPATNDEVFICQPASQIHITIYNNNKTGCKIYLPFYQTGGIQTEVKITYNQFFASNPPVKIMLIDDQGDDISNANYNVAYYRLNRVIDGEVETSAIDEYQINENEYVECVAFRDPAMGGNNGVKWLVKTKGNIFSDSYTYDGDTFNGALIQQTGFTTTMGSFYSFNPDVVTSSQTIDIMPTATSLKYVINNPSNFSGTIVRLPYKDLHTKLDHIWIQNNSPSQSIELVLYDDTGSTISAPAFRKLSNPHTISSTFTLDSQHTICLNAFEVGSTDSIRWNYFEFN